MGKKKKKKKKKKTGSGILESKDYKKGPIKKFFKFYIKSMHGSFVFFDFLHEVTGT